MSVTFKARRSLKTLPRLPPCPFDLSIKPRRRRRRIAVVSVLPAPCSITMSLAHPIVYGETFEKFWPAVPAADDFHPALYMTIRDPTPLVADAETVEHAWVSARKALKAFTDICYRSYLNDTGPYQQHSDLCAGWNATRVATYPRDGIHTDRTPIYAPDGTLHGAAWRRLEVADMVELFIASSE
ncbi:hypothetical protein C8R44DRAFT_879674 [Mycena epipterygia]|nr:hypothetical protein C8R44DRAFT_879674 [Mycena epipterygia]